MTLLDNLKEQAANPPKDGTPMDMYQNVIGNVTSLDDDRNRLIQTGETLVKKAVQSGKIRAFAFEKPRKASDDPIEIEPSMLTGRAHLRWDNGNLTTHGLQLIEVRFISTARASALEAGWKAADAKLLEVQPSRPPGRPSMQNDIQQAFDALVALGKIHTSKTMRSHYSIIREWLTAHSSHIKTSDNNPSDETIRRVVSPYFKAKTSKL